MEINENEFVLEERDLTEAAIEISSKVFKAVEDLFRDQLTEKDLLDAKDKVDQIILNKIEMLLTGGMGPGDPDAKLS